MTQEYLMTILNYDKDSGLFTYKKSKPKIKVGNIAGTLKKDGYIRIKIDGKLHYAHRLAWLYINGYFPKFVDHINHLRDDNRWVNLRKVTLSENGMNMPMLNTNTSGFTGVYPHKKNGTWIVQIKVRGDQKYLGSFKTKEEAVNARKTANIQYGFHENHGAKK